MSSEYVLPTKLFLLELKNKLGLIKFAKKILERKRDSLREAIKLSLGFLDSIIRFLKKELMIFLSETLATAIQYEDQLKAYAGVQTEKLQIVVRYIPKSGVLMPKLTIANKPLIKDRLPEGLRSLVHNLYDKLDDIIRIAEMIISLELLLREIEITNRIVNTLEKVVIPDIQEKINYINSMLSEFMISELSSLRVILASMEAE